MKKAAGLVLETELDGKKFILLRERGRINFKNGKIQPESWSGLYQVTVHGGLNPGESFQMALQREINEELGLDFFTWMVGKPTLINHFVEEEKKEVQTFLLQIRPSLIEKIRLEPTSGAIRLVGKEDLDRLREADPSMKAGVPDRENIYMFSDEAETIRKILETF